MRLLDYLGNEIYRLFQQCYAFFFESLFFQIIGAFDIGQLILRKDTGSRFEAFDRFLGPAL